MFNESALITTEGWKVKSFMEDEVIFVAKIMYK